MASSEVRAMSPLRAGQGFFRGLATYWMGAALIVSSDLVGLGGISVRTGPLAEQWHSLACYVISPGTSRILVRLVSD